MAFGLFYHEGRRELVAPSRGRRASSPRCAHMFCFELFEGFKAFVLFYFLPIVFFQSTSAVPNDEDILSCVNPNWVRYCAMPLIFKTTRKNQKNMNSKFSGAIDFA